MPPAAMEQGAPLIVRFIWLRLYKLANCVSPMNDAMRADFRSVYSIVRLFYAARCAECRRGTGGEVSGGGLNGVNATNFPKGSVVV